MVSTKEKKKKTKHFIRFDRANGVLHRAIENQMSLQVQLENTT